MQLVKSVLGLAAIAVLAGSCNNVDFKKTKGGLPYKLFASKSGKKIETGNYIKANITQKVKDSTVFTTYGSMPIYLPIGPSQPYDITEILPTLKQGDSVYAVQLIDSLIARNPGATMPPSLKKGDKVTTTIKIVDVFKTPAEVQADEDKARTAYLKNEDVAVQEYLRKNNIQAQKTGTGTYVQVINPGQGTPIDAGKYVSVMYKGSTFGGKVFDSNMDPKFGHTQPLSFVVGGGMIKGFDEGIRLLKKGGKGRIFIPSMLGYGPQSPSPDIKPFENLIFDVDVVDVADKAPAQAQGMPGQAQGAPANNDTNAVH